jgi:hypothetical protein
MGLKKEGQGKERAAMSSPFHLNTPASDDSFPSLLAVIDGTDPMLQTPQPWYDKTSPYTVRHYSKPEPLELTLNQLATNDEGDHYVHPSSRQSTSSSIPTVSPTSAQSEDESSNANNTRVATTAAACQAVSEAGTPIAHEGVQPHDPAAHPPLQRHSGSEGRPHQSPLSQRAPTSDGSAHGATPPPDYPADGPPGVRRQRQNHHCRAHCSNQGTAETSQQVQEGGHRTVAVPRGGVHIIIEPEEPAVCHCPKCCL